MNRIVEITGSKIVDRQQPGVANPVPTRMWEGTLFQMDGKTPESRYTWTDAGGFFGTAQGVSSPYDLENLISAPEPEAQPEIEVPATRLQVEAIEEYRGKMEAAEKHAEIMAESLTESRATVESLRATLGLIRFRAVEANDTTSDNPLYEVLRNIVSVVNEAIGE